MVEALDKVQNEAVSRFLSVSKGTVVAHTGIGKTFIFFKSLYALQESGYSLRKVLFLAEVQDRYYDLEKNAENFLKIYGKHPLKDFKVEFLCYQSAYKLKRREYDFVCADEIHFALSPKYSEFFTNNTIHKLLGITATTEAHVKYRGKTKEDYLKAIAPICFTYDINEGRDNKTFRDLEVYVIKVPLSTDKTIRKKTKASKVFYVSEKQDYDFWTKMYVEALKQDDGKLKEIAVRKRMSVIYNSISRKEALEKLVSYLEKKKERTLVFGNSLDVLHKVVPTTISSRNKPVQNEKFRKMFEEGKISLLGSFKKLKQGANLPMLKNIVIHSYYSSGGDLVQRIGRARLAPDAAKIYIFLDPDTVELEWFTSMMKDIDIEPIYLDNIYQLK